MDTVPVIYKQALTGERWRHYGTWARYVPLPLLERISGRLPVKPLWTQLIPCGDRQAELSVLAGPGLGLVQRNRDAQAPVILSHNLSRQLSRQDRLGGRALTLSLLRRILPSLANDLDLFGDRLSIALAVSEWERAFWLVGVEPYARSITVFLQPTESARSLGPSGIAVRRSGYDAGKVDAHVLIYSPDQLESVGRLALRQGTLLVSTDGLAREPFYGCLALDMSMSPQLGLPQVIWADQQDELPVLETVIVAAFLKGQLSRWPTYLPNRVTAMDRAFAWSGWPASYRLLSEGESTSNDELKGDLQD